MACTVSSGPLNRLPCEGHSPRQPNMQPPTGETLGPIRTPDGTQGPGGNAPPPPWPERANRLRCGPGVARLEHVPGRPPAAHDGLEEEIGALRAENFHLPMASTRLAVSDS